MTIFIGLTGGIACGKTSVTKSLVSHHIAVLDCDLIARIVVSPGTPALKSILHAFQNDSSEPLLLPDGTLNRKALGVMVFSDPEKRKRLEGITGPAIFKSLAFEFVKHWLVGTPVVLVDAPTLYETKFLIPFLSRVVVVASSPQVQLQRLMERDGAGEEDARRRIAAQMPVELKVAKADVVVWNDGSREEFGVKLDVLADELIAMGNGPRRLFSGPGFLALVVFGWVVNRWRHF